MPDAPMVSTDDLQQLYRQQKPGQPLPGAPPLMDQDQLNGMGGPSPAMEALRKYNDFLTSQQGSPDAGTQPISDSTGGQAPAVHTPVPGMVPTGGVPSSPGRTGGFPPAAPPPPMAVGGQGVVGTTPSAGLNNGNSLPTAPAGGSNMRIQNGSQIQDIQYTPDGRGGVRATTMRDAGTGLTFQQGANGQFYPAGTSPGMQALSPGQSFQNAQTNVGQAGWEADQAMKLGMQPDPATLAGLRNARLMGAAPGSPVGQSIIRQSIAEYNETARQQGLVGMQNQNKIQLAELAMDPLKNLQLEYGRGLAALAARGATPEETADYISNMNQAMTNASAMRNAHGGPPNLPGLTPPGGPAVAPPPVPGGFGGGTAPAVGGGGAGPLPTAGPAAAAGGPLASPATLTQQYQQRQQLFGPEIAKAMTQRLDPKMPLPEGKKAGDFAVDPQQLLTMMFQYDRSHPGTMQQHGQQFIDAMNSTRGEQAMRDFMRPNPLAETYFLGDPNDTNQARAAFRNFTGTAPNLTVPDALVNRGLVGAANVAQNLGPLSILSAPIMDANSWLYGKQGPVIPGSPAARKAIEALNAADAGKGLPKRRGRAGTED